MKKRPFTHLLSEHIFENYKDKSFSSITLEDFAKKYNKGRSTVSQHLLEMKRLGKVKVVGEIPKKQGGSTVKIYKIIEDADLEIAPLKNRVIEWRKSQALKEKKQTEACLRLCKALDIMTANR